MNRIGNDGRESLGTYARGEVLTARGSCGRSRSTKGPFHGLNTVRTECYRVVFSANIHANRTVVGGISG